MTYAQVEQMIKDILAKQLGLEVTKIRPNSKLIEELGMDSFGSIETAFELEEKFELKIPDEAIYNAKTVQDIVDYIAKEKGAA